MLAAMQVINCCPKCTQVIEWKIQFGKYKTLTRPATCLDCKEKAVKYAYHTRCIPCVEKSKRCSKCGDSQAEFVNLPPPSDSELAKKDAEFKSELKRLPERKRRTLLRYMEKLKLDSENPENENQEAIRDKLQEYTEKYAKNDFEFDEFDDERSDVSDDSDNEDLDD